MVTCGRRDRLLGAGYSAPHRRDENSCPRRFGCPVHASSVFDRERPWRGLPWKPSPSCLAIYWPSSTTASTALSFTATSAGCRGPSRWCTSSVTWSALRWWTKRSSAGAPPTTRPGWKPSPAIIACRSNGPRRACARTTMSCPRNAAWPGTTPTASISSSRAWSRGRASASASPNTPPRACPRESGGSKLQDPRPPTQPLHALLLLPPRPNLGPDGDAGGLVLPVPDHLLPQRPQLYRAGAQAGADRLPQDRQCLPRRRRRGGAAGRRRPAEPSHHPRPARLLDLDPGPEVLHQGAQAAQSLTLLCDRPDRVLPQLHLQAQLSHPQTVRAQLRARLMAPDCRQNH